MKAILARIAIAGALALGGTAIFTLPASAQCIVPGSTDCPMTPGTPPSAQWNQAAPNIVDRGAHWAGRNWDRPRHWDGRRNWNRHRNWSRHWQRGRHNVLPIPVPVPVPVYRDRYVYEDDYRDRRYRVRGLSEAHIQWCFDRYRSYRVRDNTFQPYEGPRRQCYSPYS